MNISTLHTEEKALSVVPLKKNGEGTLLSIHLEPQGELPKHITAVPAVLICISGHTLYGTAKGEEVTLHAGDLVHIEPNLEHWLKGIERSELILMK